MGRGWINGTLVYLPVTSFQYPTAGDKQREERTRDRGNDGEKERERKAARVNLRGKHFLCHTVISQYYFFTNFTQTHRISTIGVTMLLQQR